MKEKNLKNLPDKEKRIRLEEDKLFEKMKSPPEFFDVTDFLALHKQKKNQESEESNEQEIDQLKKKTCGVIKCERNR